MRSYLPAFDLRVAGDASTKRCALLARAGAPLASVRRRHRPDGRCSRPAQLPHTQLRRPLELARLRGIDCPTATVAIGALTTYTDVLASDAPARASSRCSARRPRETGGIATQNRGTLGGNIANASPAADTPPALLVYDAELELVSARGTRRVPYATFHTGYKKMDLAPDELIARSALPRPALVAASYYRKVGTRRAQAISKVCFAGALEMEDGVVTDVRLAFGSVAPTCLRARGAEDAVRGRPLNAQTRAAARAALAGDIAPIDDMRSSSRYRATVAANVMEAFLSDAPPPELC